MNLTLLPMPRRLIPGGETYILQPDRRIAIQGQGTDLPALLFAAQRLQAALGDYAHVHWPLTAAIAGQPDEIGAIIRLAPEQAIHAQGYELAITPQGITIDAGDPAGAFYGVCTLIQILQSAIRNPQSEIQTLPCLHLTDWPDFPARGVLLDISRDKVPTMETLYALVDLLASWKVNQFQLYTEHTFAYRNHPEVWANASPMMEQEILELDAYCRLRHVELVPNQNSFGHLARWLQHPRYAPLAEITGQEDDHWWGRGPFSLCPLDAGSIALMQSLYDELLPGFSSRYFNVGCDETFDLSQGRSQEECERRGVGRVYLDYLLQVYQAVKERGRTMQFWGDIILQHPELIAELPTDVIALEWGYEADHPFDQDGAQFAQAGIPFYVCPGTSSWNSIAGRTDNAIANILNAAENGLKHGAIGFLNTDWGDNGHWQFTPTVSYLGYGLGAAVSWAVEANRALDIARAISLFAFGDSSGAMGRLAYDLGNVYLALGVPSHNASGLFRLMGRSLAQIREAEGLSPDALRSALDAIERAMQPLAGARMERPDARLVECEFASASHLLRHAAQRGLLAFMEDADEAGRLAQELQADMARFIPEYESLWLARNRRGGLVDSVSRFHKAAEAYQSD